ncbi:MAG: L,D-transpeptidase [Patescibacteria group bacterium]|nr:L,D-transpeptidase [Patescibacteria group bacterium]
MAEAQLIEDYQLVAQGRLREALARSDSLVRRYPDFALANLLRGDLLLAQAGRLRRFADFTAPPDRQPELAALVREARARLLAYQDAPLPGRVPSNFVALGPQVRHAILVDTGRSRLYLFVRNPQGELRLEANFYVTQGKSGADKRLAGDMRTPSGVYFITRKVGRRWLGPVYGNGAMPLNYPNAWDRYLGRTGGGIWLHGVQSGNYAQPPLDSNGCVVLANPDLAALMQSVVPDLTPVVITDHVRWITPSQLASRRARLQTALGRVAPALLHGDATLLEYQGKRPLLVTQYASQIGDVATLHRDYWTDQGGRWNLVHAGVVS